MSSSAAREPGATLDAWRERGDHLFDPVRFHFLAVLAGRAAAQSGAARRVLDARLATLLAAYGEQVEGARCGPAATRMAASPPEPSRGMLGELVDHVARERGADHGSSPQVLTALRYFRSTWSRLNARRQLTQSLAAVPKNAGPLNSHQLVHQALSLMGEVSPEYLERFMSYANALLWIDRASSPSTSRAAPARRAASNRAAAGRPKP